MSLEDNLRQALQEEAEGWSAPPELKRQILSRIAPGQGGRRMKKWLIATVLAATLIIPTGVYAGYNYLADSVYDSQENFVRSGGTQQQYDMLEAKLQQAKQSLSEEDFRALTSLLHDIGSFNLKIADAKGVLHPEKLNASDQQSYKKLAAEVEPFFEKLNIAGSAKTPVEATVSNTFWDNLLVQAEQTFSGEELVKVRELINELKASNAKGIIALDGSTQLERLTDEELAQQKQLMNQLNPYLKKLGILLKPSS